MDSKLLVAKILKKAGITINGNNDWDIIAKNSQLYDRVLTNGSVGLGEAYMDGWWECKKLDVFFAKVLGSNLDKIPELENGKLLMYYLRASLFNFGSKIRAFDIAKKHYNLGNDLFENMLGEVMAYSCGYWKNAKNLKEAQLAKFKLIANKLHLQPGMEVLDIGCGWGEFTKYLAENYQVNVVGITVSTEQAKLAKKKSEGLSVKIKVQDYRDLSGAFDRIVSIGMFEHVGYKNYREYMKTIHRLLKKDGLSLLHTIGGNHSVRATDPWIDKYIFPGGMLPSITQIGKSIEGLFVMEDWHNFGSDYDKTLMAWYRNFEKIYPSLKNKYNQRFYRMWKYYLLISAGSFRARKNQLWQIVLSKNGVAGGYNFIR